MSTVLPKLSAMAGAACLLASMALPAHAAPLPASPVAATPRVPAVAVAPAQTLTVGATTAAVADVKGGALVSTLIPVPVAPVVETVAAPPQSAGSTAEDLGEDTTTSAPSASVPVAAAPAQSGSAVLDYAAQFVGVVPYGMGNTPDTSFSCDGFVQYVFSAFGYSLPRGADHQAAMGTPITRAEAVAGDLVWWPGQHIGIYDGAGGMYDSPNWGRFVQHPAQLWGSPTFIRLG